ncbi:hypothetical protein AKO1_003687 [Acrasis kona]|uniref:Bestrophin homolog n=1 Tax=Acrasis kona TaxID=1008807 RepID=A0AAW2Z626_9EUKA
MESLKRIFVRSKPEYNPLNPELAERRFWLKTIFLVHKTVLPKIAFRIILLTLLTVFLNLLKQFAGLAYHMPIQVHSLIGVCLGLLLVYRTNSSYDRYHEGRRLWGALINCSRNMIRLVNTIERDLPTQQLSNLVIAFNYALKSRLRGKTNVDEFAPLLTAGQLALVESAKNRPVAISALITRWIWVNCRNCKENPILFQTVDTFAMQLIDAQGGLERIALTPIPFNYVVHINQTLFYYLVTLPFCMLNDFGWFSVPSIAFVSFALLGVEHASIEMEDPFGIDKFDLPLDVICTNIKENLTFLSTNQLRIESLVGRYDSEEATTKVREVLPPQVVELSFPTDSKTTNQL